MNTIESNLSENRIKASLQSKGSSSGQIINSLISVFKSYNLPKSSSILDIGCGKGTLLEEIYNLQYHDLHGRDLVKFHSLPYVQFETIDCNANFGENQKKYDAILSSEVIEHIENPRNFIREMKKLLSPGGLMILSTPNPESLSSLLSFLVRGYFSAFGPKDYPAHITPVAVYDMKHILEECGLDIEEIFYIPNGRIPGTAKTWGQFLPFRGKRFAENYIVVARPK